MPRRNSKNLRRPQAKKGRKTPKRRNIIALGALKRKAGPMKDRRAPRGGTKTHRKSILKNMKTTNNSQWLFRCDCGTAEHDIVLRRDVDRLERPELTLYIQMATWQPWPRRLWSAIRYVFGFNPTWGHWDSTVISASTATNIKGVLDEYIRDTALYQDGL